VKSAQVAVLIFLSSIPCALAQDIPTGFKIERYTKLWEQNPFYAVKQAGPAPQPLVFDKLFMTSWLEDRGKEVVYVQNSETNEVQQITTASNQNNLRLVVLHRNANPQFVRAVISDGEHEGTIRFRFDSPPPSVAANTSPMAQGPNNSATVNPPNPGAVSSLRVPRPPPANVPKTQTPALPSTVPVNRRPAYRIREGTRTDLHE
jgi:hypothetical protein